MNYSCKNKKRAKKAYYTSLTLTLQKQIPTLHSSVKTNLQLHSTFLHYECQYQFFMKGEFWSITDYITNFFPQVIENYSLLK